MQDKGQAVPALTGAAGRRRRRLRAAGEGMGPGCALLTLPAVAVTASQRPQAFSPHPQPHLLPLLSPLPPQEDETLHPCQAPVCQFPQTPGSFSSHCLMLIVTSSPLPLHLSRPPQNLLHSEKNGGKSLLAAGLTQSQSQTRSRAGAPNPHLTQEVLLLLLVPRTATSGQDAQTWLPSTAGDPAGLERLP